MAKMKAVGNFIFAGSASIGVMNTGLFEIDRVLEITDEIVEQNAKHFIHNYPSIPVVIPSTWEKEGYRESIKDVDLLYSNCPCSGLSQINRNAKADNKANIHFYRTFDNIMAIKPKAFLIENAPTTIALGYPILKDMINQLGEHYRFTIVRDRGGNHGVAMQRTRTFIIGWRRDVFENRIPVLRMNKQPRTTVAQAIGRFENARLGDEDYVSHRLVKDRDDMNLEKYFKELPCGYSIRQFICENWDKYSVELDEKTLKSFNTMKTKYDNGQNYWDKSPRRFHDDDIFPSLSSVANFIHPKLDRQLTVREYAAIMNYPDDFEFVEDAKVPEVQAIAQGVPANFFKYIAYEVGQALLGNRLYIKADDTVAVFQNHINKFYRTYNMQEINESNRFEVDKKTTRGMLAR